MGQPSEHKPPEMRYAAATSPPQRTRAATPLLYGGGSVPREALYAPLPIGRSSPFVPHVVRKVRRR